MVLLPERPREDERPRALLRSADHSGHRFVGLAPHDERVELREQLAEIEDTEFQDQSFMDKVRNIFG